ncbi:hypothetical protein JR334_03930 [Clostridia bacterium]|nr:hypothetical protein JR334_03930 [Clostridia bacterium]
MKKKRTIVETLRDIEEDVVNVVIRHIRNRTLHRHLLLSTDTISPAYKKEIKEYWGKFNVRINTDWHKFYSSRTKLYDVRYIPEDLHIAKIDKYYNDKSLSRGVDDKNYYSLWFPNIKKPRIVVRKINGLYYDEGFTLLDQVEVIALCQGYEELIVKPAIGSGNGQGIDFWKRSQGTSELERIIFDGVDDLTVQEILEQHEELEKVHHNSINTIRIMSLLLGEKVHIVSSVLRMGTGESRVDNLIAGGLACGIKENGQLKDIAYSFFGVKYDRHPQGFVFADGIVPSFDQIKKIIMEEHMKLAHFRLISWDFSVDKEGNPVLIEMNLREGATRLHQLNNGPLFGNLTEEVLSEVFLK